jgi:hypothetical protein
MRKTALVVLVVSWCCLLACSDAAAKGNVNAADVLQELVRDLQKSGISQKDIKGMNKALENMLGKGGSKNDIVKIIAGLAQNGLSGDGLIKSVNGWNDLIEAGDSHGNSAETILKSLEHGKKKGLQGDNLAATIQQALQQRKGGFSGGASPELQELIRELERNGATQSDLRAAQKALKNILEKGGNKNVTRALLIDMIKNGVTGTYFLDAIASWNDAVNAGQSNQRVHDILSNTLKNSKAKGLKDKELAAIIQEVLKNSHR